MALSGTLETFSLPDVLRLLSNTKKTGLLALDGDRGWGRVWVDGGGVVAAAADRAVVSDIDGVLFELLRFAEAAFEFDTTAELPDGAGAPRDVDEALALAEERLEEWREIEAVVPSLDVRVRMAPAIDDEVAVAAVDWQVLARIGTGARGHDLADHLGQGEYDVCRHLRDLVDAGLVEVTDTAADDPTPAVADAFAAMVHPPAPEPTPVFEVDLGGSSEVDAEPELEPVDEVASVAELTEEPEADDGLGDLALLSPRAAAAVEATWSPEPVEDASDAEAEPVEDTEPVEDLEEAPEVPAAGGDDLDQNLLLRFLSSAKP